MDQKKSGIFVREATGLVRNVSLLDVISINLGSMSLAPALATLGLTMVLVPSVGGMNLVYASLIGALLVVPMVVVYTMMSARIKRTGGDYVWVSRAFGGLFGGSLALSGWVVAAFAFVALDVIATVLAIGSVGVQLGYLNLLPLALPSSVPGSSPNEQVVIVVVIMLAFLLLNLFNSRLGFRIVSAMMIFSLITLLMAIGVLFAGGSSGATTYVSYLQSVGSNVTYSSIVSAYQGSNFDLGATLFILPFFAIFVYPYFNAGPAVGSETRGKNTSSLSIPIAAFMGTIVLTAALAAMYASGGLPFINSALSNSNLVYNYSFNFFTLAMVVSNNLALQWIIGIGWIVGLLLLIGINMLILPRYMFAMSFDHFIPSQLSYVNPRSGSPTYGQIVYAVVTTIMAILATYLYGTLTSLYGAVAATMIYFIFIGLAAVVYGVRNRADRSRVPLMISGVLMAIVFTYFLYDFLEYPQVWGGNLLAYGYSVIAFLIGVGSYLISKRIFSKKGIDIAWAFKDLPPE